MRLIRQAKRVLRKTGLFWKARGLPVENRRYTCDRRVFFMGGCGRSGTTLLRTMLGAHPDIFSGPELNVHANILYRLDAHPLLPRYSYLLYDHEEIRKLAGKFDLAESEICEARDNASCLADFIDRLLTRAAAKLGKTYWLEKTPWNVNYLDFLFRYFPNARFVHVIRDGRDVACSLRRHEPFLTLGGARKAEDIKDVISKAAARWIRDVSAGLAWRGDPRYMEVRYEDLVTGPEAVLRRICDHLGVAFDPRMLEHHKFADRGKRNFNRSNPNAVDKVSASSVGRWKHDLTRAEAERFHALAGDLLERLGYLDEKSSFRSYP